MGRTPAGVLVSLPSYIDLGTHIVIHAGLRPDIPLNQQSLDDLVELRTLAQIELHVKELRGTRSTMTRK
jgi:hypothetical protein